MEGRTEAANQPEPADTHARIEVWIELIAMRGAENEACIPEFRSRQRHGNRESELRARRSHNGLGSWPML